MSTVSRWAIATAMLAIDARGRKLPAPKDSGRGELARGPLRWQR